MQIIRLIFGLTVAMIALTVVVEGIELLIVVSISDMSMTELQANQTEYFSIRNQTWILILKVIYTFSAGFFAGWLGSRITKFLKPSFFIILCVLQVIAFFYAMFFSEFKDTLPMLLWLLLLCTILYGIYLGHLTSSSRNDV